MALGLKCGYWNGIRNKAPAKRKFSRLRSALRCGEGGLSLEMTVIYRSAKSDKPPIRGHSQRRRTRVSALHENHGGGEGCCFVILGPGWAKRTSEG
jgi:hypothetical protein